MSKENLDHEKDNKSYLETNPVAQRTKAQEVLAKAKKLEAEKIAAGKKWYTTKDGKTSFLK